MRGWVFPHLSKQARIPTLLTYLNDTQSDGDNCYPHQRVRRRLFSWCSIITHVSPAISDLFIFLLFCAVRRTKFTTRTSPHPSRMICHPQRGEAQNLDYIGHGTRLSVITFSVRHIFLYAAKQLSPQLRLWQWKAALTQSEYHPSARGGGAYC